jgi:Galactose oxidase, central domain
VFIYQGAVVSRGGARMHVPTRLGLATLIVATVGILLTTTFSGSSLTPAGFEGSGGLSPAIAGVWTQISNTSMPGPRNGSAMVYVAPTSYGDHGELLFGGFNSTGALLADTWVYNTTTSRWVMICSSTTCGPSPRWGATLIEGDTWVILFGGCASKPTAGGGCPNVLDDTWVFGTSPSSPGSPGCTKNTWVKLTPTVSPSPRFNAPGMAPSSGANIAYLFGGETVATNALNDTWAFTPGCNLLNTTGYASDPWHPVAIGHSSATPSARWGAGFSATSNNATFTGLLFGGGSGSPVVVQGNTYGFTCSSGCTYVTKTSTIYGNWTLLALTGPPARELMGLAATATTNEVALFGGRSATTTYGDTWTWNFATHAWTAYTIPVSPPARSGMGFDFDAAAGANYLYGGQGVTGQLHDFWMLR